MPRSDGVKSVLIYASRGSIDQFAGVPKALERKGRRVFHERLWGEEIFRGCHAQPSLIRRMDAVVMADLRHNLHARPVRLARRFGVPTVLLVDGVTEFSNIYMNPWLGDAHLRPAPEDAVLCLGELQRRILSAMGNRVRVTGLPRLDGFAERVQAAESAEEQGALLVATANFPCVTESGLARLSKSLAALRDACDTRGLAVRWRLTGTLCERLGVERDAATLAGSLASSRAVITTASTLAVEAMLCGRPTCILHPHPWPLWIPGVLEWRPGFAESDGVDGDASLVRQALSASAEVRAEADRALDDLRRRAGTRVIDEGPLSRQAGDVVDAVLGGYDTGQCVLLSAMHTDRAGGRVADAIESVLESPAGIATGALERIGRTEVKLECRGSKSRSRVVALIEDNGQGLDAIGVRAVERSVELLDDSRLEFHTLLIARGPTNFRVHHAHIERPNRVSHTCVLEPTDATHERIEQIVRSARMLNPDVVLSLGRYEGRTGAFQLRTLGIPVLVREVGESGNEWLDGDPETWASLADAQGRSAGATDESVRFEPSEAERDQVRHPDDPDEADRWIEQRLTQAGFKRIARGTPSAGCDAVLVRASDPRPTPEMVRSWRAAGLGVGVSPNMGVETLIVAAQSLLERLRLEGRERILIFGAGERSLAFASLLDDYREIIGFIDDSAEAGDTHLGLPAAKPTRIEDLRADCVIVNTRHFDPILALRSWQMEPERRVASLLLGDAALRALVWSLRTYQEAVRSGQRVAATGDFWIARRYADVIGAQVLGVDEINAAPRPDVLLVAAANERRAFDAALPWARAGTTIHSVLGDASADQVEHSPSEGGHTQTLSTPATHGV